MIEFPCGKCGAVLRVKDDQVGTEIPCQWCGQEHTVPDPDTAPPETIRFRCPECGVLLGMSAAYGGREVRCHECSEVVLVPEVGDGARRVPDPQAPPPPKANHDPNIIEFGCQFCGYPFRVSRELAGRKGKCRKCGAVNVVPSEEPKRGRKP